VAVNFIFQTVTSKTSTKDDPDRRTQVVLLAKDFNGYKNLAKLSSIGFLKGFYFGVPRISRELIANIKKGYCLNFRIHGIFRCHFKYGEQKGEELFKWWKDTFGDDFMFRSRTITAEEEHLNDVLFILQINIMLKFSAE
jgi:DNA polymerase-3 subunit alpha